MNRNDVKEAILKQIEANKENFSKIIKEKPEMEKILNTKIEDLSYVEANIDEYVDSSIARWLTDIVMKCTDDRIPLQERIDKYGIDKDFIDIINDSVNNEGEVKGYYPLNLPDSKTTEKYDQFVQKKYTEYGCQGKLPTSKELATLKEKVESSKGNDQIDATEEFYLAASKLGLFYGFFPKNRIPKYVKETFEEIKKENQN